MTSIPDLFSVLHPDVNSQVAVAAKVIAERRRQIALGYDLDHDDSHTVGQLRNCARCILLCMEYPPLEMESLDTYRDRVRKHTPYGPGNWLFLRATKVVHKYDAEHTLVVAMALLMAENERLLRERRDEDQK